MPELPEVETIARGLSAALAGASVRDVAHARPDYVLESPPGALGRLAGRAVTGVTRHGKRLTIHLAGTEIVVHLGMSGRIGVVAGADEREPHTHLVLRLAAGGDELRVVDPRRFGGVWIRGEGAAAVLPRPNATQGGAHLGPLGPDALAIPLPAFRALLARPRRIKALLLDQHAIAGLGNIYVDEMLWAAQVHPLTPAASIREDAARELHRAMRRILNAAIRHGGSTLRDYRNASGAEGAFQRRHRVYGRDGEPCPRCAATITRRVIAGRSTHFCPRCQRRARRPRTSGRRAVA